MANMEYCLKRYFLYVQDVSSFHSIGTAALVIQVTGTNWPRPAFTLLVTGLCRFRVDRIVMEVPYTVATVTQLDKLSIEDGMYHKNKFLIYAGAHSSLIDIFTDDDENPEFASLVESFRGEATKLLDMLDVSSPVVARLKVSQFNKLWSCGLLGIHLVGNFALK